MYPLLGIILLTTFGSVIALVGGIFLLSFKKWSHTLTVHSIPFAAGVLITTSLIGLLPEASHLIGNEAFLITLLSFLGAYMFETLFLDLHHHSHTTHTTHKEHSSSVVLIMIGDSIHNFIDGVAIATAYLVNPGLGLVTAISTFLHEVPHEIGDFGIMLKAGYSKRAVFGLNFISSLSALFGAFLVYFLIKDDHFSGVLMAISAGMFLYLGASDFLPKVHKAADKFRALSIFVLGIATMYATLTLVPHSHELEHAEEHEICEEH